MATEDKQSKAAHNQMLFRSVNERILEISDSVPPSEAMSFLCECADTTCMKTIDLTPAEYEAAHDEPTHFPILPGHEWPEVERIVARHETYIVVEKIEVAAEIVVEAEQAPG